ncbi:MAG: hypothetical protein Q7W29_01965 [bacterium]|nr:hypothetical protein [bacterium]
MKNSLRVLILAGVVFAAPVLYRAYAGVTTPKSMVASPVTLSAPEALNVTDFEARLKDYLALHQKFEGTLPALSNKSTPAQVESNQLALNALIKNARADAVQGEFFTPGIRAVAVRALEGALAGPAGKASRESILDENTNVANLHVNDRYPDAIPLATMPLQVLEALPKLSEGLEYRFVGERLVLLDTHANLIVDFTDNILP